MNNQFIMVPLFIVLVVIMVWCFYLRFVMAFMKRKRLLWVEVQDYENSEYSITRNIAKQNLHLVGEITQKLKSYNYLFDKYWYRQREFQYIDGISEEQKLQFSNGEGENPAENEQEEKGTDEVNNEVKPTTEAPAQQEAPKQ